MVGAVGVNWCQDVVDLLLMWTAIKDDTKNVCASLKKNISLCWKGVDFNVLMAKTAFVNSF